MPAKKKSPAKSPAQKPSESPVPRESVETRVYELMHPPAMRGQGGISRDEALAQALKEGCKYAGR